VLGIKLFPINPKVDTPTKNKQGPNDDPEAAKPVQVNTGSNDETAPPVQPDLPQGSESEPQENPDAASVSTEATDGTEAQAKSATAKKAPSKPTPAPEPEFEVPKDCDLADYQGLSLAELYSRAMEARVRQTAGRTKSQLIFDLLSLYSNRGTIIRAEGILDVMPDGFGFLRWPLLNFRSGSDDVYVSPTLIRKHSLRTGQFLKVSVRAPKNREKYLTVDEIFEIDDQPSESYESPQGFDSLTALFPSERIILENPDSESPTPRVIDIVAPLGKGQRALIAAPPRGGKTLMLKDIACSIHRNHPEVELMILLIDERPEEVTDFEETVDALVISSTFDERPQRHAQVAELVIERAKRLVETGKDVVILLDSITRLSRGYNAVQGGRGGTMSGGLGSNALNKPRKFFGSARNCEEGGSLTIVATALIETESRMDEVIFEEFKGTGNMEVMLDREMVEKRIFPAIQFAQSGTRKDDLLYHPDEMQGINTLRKQMAQLPVGEAMETLIKNIRSTSSNVELILRGLK